MAKIVFGQYYSGDSVIHKCDARTKIITAFLILISVFIVNSFLSLAVFAAFVIAGCVLSKISVGKILASVKPILFLIALTAIFNIFFTKGEEILFTIGSVNIYLKGVLVTLRIIIRICMAIIAASLMTMTTKPLDLTNGLEKLMSPLKVIKVPVAEISIMISITLRFIPTLMEETEQIMKAQNARGADFDMGNFKDKIMAYVTVMVPLFVSAWQRAIDLATAMEARCYRGSENRTKMRELKFHKRDVIILTVFSFVVVIAFVINYIC